jgi:septum formation protein
MLILASASPRRQELLRNAGIDFIAQPADVPEHPLQGELPETFAKRMARTKAHATFDRLAADQSQLQALGADTIVVVDTEILGKPKDAVDAARMLRLLSGREHRVITGVCLLTPGDPIQENIRHETTRVTVTMLANEEIAAYVATGEPMDKAGAYAIQGQASRWIPKIEGCYFNVVGLPVSMVYSMLKEKREG